MGRLVFYILQCRQGRIQDIFLKKGGAILGLQAKKRGGGGGSGGSPILGPMLKSLHIVPGRGPKRGGGGRDPLDPLDPPMVGVTNRLMLNNVF